MEKDKKYIHVLGMFEPIFEQVCTTQELNKEK